ncbi:GntR family transcriptional regulator [Humitalea sp. 24SJ18S-53]|uniref:GntR family transcriptional regulator n=1 Tax=Humitalea sp. 24SJ18S-53 TaxID=3422307 RepID=UPI003D668C55
MEVKAPVRRVILPPAAPARASLADAAYAALKASILEGLLPPGQETAEQVIADQLAMSRTPVHEALVRLQHEGMVTVLPRRGVRVLPIDPEDLRQTYEVLIALEGAAAALLARRAAPGATALATMTEATEAMAAALGQGDRAAWAAADDRFHRALVAGSGNPKLARLAENAADQAQRARSVTAARRPEPTASGIEHAAILAAIGAGDAEAARAAAAAHRARASAEILAALQRA